MNYIKELANLSKDTFVEESISVHDEYPALFSGEMDLQVTDCEEFIRNKVEVIFQKSRERWSGLKNMSFYYGIDSTNRKLKYYVGISSENITFSEYVLDFIKRFLPKLESSDVDKLQSDGDSDTEEDKSSLQSNSEESGNDSDGLKKPAELVQINADPDMVKCWIDSFIKSRRGVVNAQNVREFCLPPDKRQNCARVDAVLVTRKDTSSHIRVEHVSNLWGPQIRKELSSVKAKITIEEHNYSITKRSIPPPEPTGCPPQKKKKVYSSQDVATKLEELKNKYRMQKPS